MKKIFLCATAILLFCSASFSQSTLDYSGYHKIFDDEFDYPGFSGGLSGACTSTTGTTLGQTFQDNWLTRVWCYGGTTIYEPSQVTMPVSGVLRFTDNVITATTMSDGGCTSVRDHLSGGIFAWNPPFINLDYGFGILEASIRIVCDTGNTVDDTKHFANSAFWTDHLQGNEIDVIDVSENNFVIYRNIDWHYGTGSSYTIGPHVETGCYSSTSNYCDTFHVFAVVWTPTNIKYYLDGVLQNELYYDHVRIYPGFDNLELALNADSYTHDGMTMDVDWINAWRPKCNEDSFNLNATNYSTVIPPICSTCTFPYLPDFLKYKNVIVNVPIASTAHNIVPGYINGTTDLNGYGVSIIEGESVTILPDFLADESVLQLQWSISLANCTYTPQVVNQIANGYLLISTLGKDGCITDNTSNNNLGWYRQGASINNSGGSNSVSDLSTKIQINPNPATDNVIITFASQVQDNMEIRIADMSGREQYSESFAPGIGNNLQHIVNVSPLIPGVYIVYITLNNQQAIKKLVKL